MRGSDHTHVMLVEERVIGGNFQFKGTKAYDSVMSFNYGLVFSRCGYGNITNSLGRNI